MTDTSHTTLQNAVRERLIDHAPGFASYDADLPGRCPVLCQDDGDLITKINTAIGKIGILCIVTVPSLNCTLATARPPVYNRVAVRVELYELGITNRGDTGSQIPALEWAERAAAALHGWTPAGRAAEFILDPDRSITPEAHPDLVIYHVNLRLGGRR